MFKKRAEAHVPNLVERILVAPPVDGDFHVLAFFGQVKF
jgi:hypothetical protein